MKGHPSTVRDESGNKLCAKCLEWAPETLFDRTIRAIPQIIYRSYPGKLTD